MKVFSKDAKDCLTMLGAILDTLPQGSVLLCGRARCAALLLPMLCCKSGVLQVLKQVMEEKVTAQNVDIAKVAPTYHMYTIEEIGEVLSRV